MVIYSLANSACSSENRLGNVTVPPHNPDVAANDFCLFRVRKESVVGQNFGTSLLSLWAWPPFPADNFEKCLCSHLWRSYSNGKKCVELKRDYIEKLIHQVPYSICTRCMIQLTPELTLHSSYKSIHVRRSKAKRGDKSFHITIQYSK
jgi:hypothetical protein